MQELVRWQQGMERLARDFYAQAAEAYKGDAALYQFLQRLERDEEDHERLMGEVAESLEGIGEPPQSAIKISKDMTTRLTAAVRKAHDDLQAGKLSKKELIDCIVATEFSEWNDIFLYILNATKEVCRTSQRLAAIIQTHEERVQRFVENLSPELKPEQNLWALPKIWDREVLVVDDSMPFRTLLDAVFSREAKVRQAENGAVGLSIASEHFFDLIVSDINMPEMNGLEFYRCLVDRHPDMRERILFCSGGMSSAQEDTLRQTGRPCLAKPFDLSVLNQIAASILHQEPNQA